MPIFGLALIFHMRPAAPFPTPSQPHSPFPAPSSFPLFHLPSLAISSLDKKSKIHGHASIRRGGTWGGCPLEKAHWPGPMGEGEHLPALTEPTLMANLDFSDDFCARDFNLSHQASQWRGDCDPDLLSLWIS